MNALSERLAALSPRERLIVLLGGTAALVIVLYSLAWQPWQAELARLREQVPRKAQTLKWMQAQAARIESLSQKAGAESARSGLPMLTLVERSAGQAGMREVITRMSPGDKENQIRVWIDDAEFDLWLRWLEVLNENGIDVAQANVDRAENNRVDIRTTLQR